MANIDFPPGAINGTTHTQNGKTWIYDGTSWSLVASLIPDASTTVNGLVNTSTQSFSGDKKFVNNLDIVGGLGVTGSTTLYSTLRVDSITTISNNTNTTSSTQGALIVVGGIGVSGNIEVGSALEVLGASRFGGGIGVTGSVNLTSGLGVSESANIGGGLGVTGTALFRNAVSIQSGGLGVTGGVTITSSGLVINSGGLGVTGQSVFRNNVEIQSGGLGVTGGVTITGSGLTINAGGLGVTGASIFRNTVTIQSGGIGITGQSVFRNNIEIQSGGLGVTGGIGVAGGVTITGSGLAVTAGGIGITGQSVFRNNVEIQSGGLGVTGGVTVTSSGLTVLSGGLGVTGQSVLRNNVEIQSGGIGVTGGVTVNSSGLTVLSGGIGITGQSVFRNNVEIQSGGLGVTGGIGVTGRIAIHAGGLGVTGAAVFNSSISAGSLSLSTPLPLSSGGTGLGSTSLANYILGTGNSSLGLEYKQIIEGSNITITHNTNSITIAAVGTSVTPGGPNNAIQYNGSGTLAGTSAFLWDDSSQRIDIKNTNNIGIGTTTAFLLQNSTASTASVQLQFSPAIEFMGRAWKTSGSPATDTIVRYLEMVEVTSGATPTGSITWKSSIHNAANQGPSYTKRAEISTNYGLGIYETTGVYKSSFINSASVTTDIYYTLPSVIPAANQVLGVAGISTSSVSLSWVSNGTVAIGTTGALAYYPGIGNTVDDATALSYSTSGTHLVITSQTATDVPLRVDGNVSSSVNLFQVRKGTTDQLVVNSSGNVSISSLTGSTSSTTGALTVTGGVGIGQSLVVSGNLFTSKVIYAGTNTYAKSGFNAGDILLDNGSRDTPGVIFYWGDNKNFGIDVYSAGSGTTSLRIVKELNESGGAELWSIDRRGIVTQTAWDVGEVIASRVYNYSDLNMSATTTVGVNTYVRIANITYTPKSSSSYIWIEFSCAYEIVGAAADDFYANITVNGTEIVYNRQIWANGAGGGTRSGTLFPISGRYTNSSTSGIGITVQAARGSSDDNGSFFGAINSGFMRIMEIGR